MIKRELLTQLRDTALPRIECLAAFQRACRRIGNEIRRRQVAFAGPKRDGSLAPAAVIHHFDDAAFGQALRGNA